MVHSPEEVFIELEHWQPVRKREDLEKILSSLCEKSLLFSFLYAKIVPLYGQIGVRRNGEQAVIHPLNVVVSLLKAGVHDEAVLCAGLIHDYVEEKVDLFRDRQKIVEKTRRGLRELDHYEEEEFQVLTQELHDFSFQHRVNAKMVEKIISATRLLTRNKRNFYYRSMINIFLHPEIDVKEIAIQVKLADRLHNILSLDCFNEEESIYQCFKNLFILNSVKHYLAAKRKERIFYGHEPMQKLFRKCAKATYDAFLTINHLCRAKGIAPITPMIQLAFKKFEMETQGMWEVTKLDRREMHLMCLFQEIIRKYDARLHHEWKEYEQRKKREMIYCSQFFKRYHFTPQQLQAVIDYKDAYALKEAVAYLLYKQDYSIEGFQYDQLFRKAR